jgi:hypothetical protein
MERTGLHPIREEAVEPDLGLIRNRALRPVSKDG